MYTKRDDPFEALKKSGPPTKDYDVEEKILNAKKFKAFIEKLKERHLLENDSEVRYSPARMRQAAEYLANGILAGCLSKFELHFCTCSDDSLEYMVDGNHTAHLFIEMEKRGVFDAWTQKDPNWVMYVRVITHDDRTKAQLLVLWKSFDRNFERTPRQIYSTLFADIYKDLRDQNISMKKDTSILHHTILAVDAYDHFVKKCAETNSNKPAIAMPTKSSKSVDEIMSTLYSCRNRQDSVYRKEFIGYVKETLAGSTNVFRSKRAVTAAVVRILDEHRSSQKTSSLAQRICREFVTGRTNDDQLLVCHQHALEYNIDDSETVHRLFYRCYNGMMDCISIEKTKK